MAAARTTPPGRIAMREHVGATPPGRIAMRPYECGGRLGDMIRRLLALLLFVLGLGSHGSAQGPRTWSPQKPDDRLKADLLLLVAHPDDDVLAGAYLARLIHEQKKRVAVAFTTSGDSGGNQAGAERGTSLGLIRRTEGLKDLATLGITNVWFLSGHDTAGQDPQRSLGNWGHARVLAEAVRIVRLSRPEVILTWLPMQVAGENHGDHQAAAVIATEAFDLSGDPTVFPEQIAAPTQVFEPLLEGLRPWQTKKIYFMSDAIDTQFMEGHGPSYSVTARSSADGKPYWQTAYEQLRAHITQYRPQLEQLAATDDAGRERMLTQAPPGDALIEPLRFVRGKSHVGGSPTGDVFESVTADPISFAPHPGYRPETATTPAIALGGPWHFYSRFWQAHGLGVLASIDLHEVGPVSGGTEVRIPLVLTNPTTSDRQVSVKTTLPDGWREQPRAFDSIIVPARGEAEISSVVIGPPASVAGSVTVSYSLTGAAAPPLSIRVVVRPGGNPLPQ
jgi:LmbE family N-acetylglucosaminyl deacetylase